ncbi:MAG: adenylosuccinate synthase [Chloroflexi bacterium]|nr:adenylosuccinate synthase [Chloroflexota bacterium]
MAVVVVIGAQWGDEGKGKVVDLLASRAQVVARYQGGSNAGHTIVNDLGEFRLHLIPSGILTPGVTCVIGNGVVVDPTVLLGELHDLQKRGVDTSNLRISDRAHVVLPYHIALDKLEEQSRGARSIGTTCRGVGPAYADKAARAGVRVADLLDAVVLRDKLAFVVEQKNRLLERVYGAPTFDFHTLYDDCLAWGTRLAPYVSDTAQLVHRALAEGRNVLLEGAQGTLLDSDFGTYPYVTSSSPTVGGACIGSGVPPRAITDAIGVFKAYSTRVGAGPLPTELLDETGEHLRAVGKEYGTTTGRPRRCGWFDAVVGRYAARINGFTSIALMRLDVLDALPLLRICVGYRCDGQPCDTVPAALGHYERCQPVYEDLPGWQTPTSGARRPSDLPEAARHYVERIERALDCPVDIVSVGAKRAQTVVQRHPFGG